jgi:hypothetical protein
MISYDEAKLEIFAEAERGDWAWPNPCRICGARPLFHQQYGHWTVQCPNWARDDHVRCLNFPHSCGCYYRKEAREVWNQSHTNPTMTYDQAKIVAIASLIPQHGDYYAMTTLDSFYNIVQVAHVTRRVQNVGAREVIEVGVKSIGETTFTYWLLSDWWDLLNSRSILRLEGNATQL